MNIKCNIDRESEEPNVILLLSLFFNSCSSQVKQSVAKEGSTQPKKSAKKKVLIVLVGSELLLGT